MKITGKVICICLLCFSTGVSAQGILGKLAKTGVGALKGTVKSTANAMVGSPEEIAASKRKTQPQPGERKPEDDTKPQPGGEGHGPGAGKWGGAPSIQIDFDGFCWECVSPSYEGIFCIPIGSSSRKFRFYKVDGGEQVGRSDWMANEEPHFNGGVCAVKSLSSRRWYILKSSGDSIALDPKITAVTNFMDGVAIASMGYGNNFFINDKGQKVYPNVKPNKAEIYPLIDGTRRLFSGDGGYGYLDAHGNVVIKPQYGEARNFSGGLAIVYDMMNTSEKFWIIDTMGKKVSEVPPTYASYGWTHSCWMSDFIHSAAVAKNNDTGKYDIEGTKEFLLSHLDEEDK